MVEQIRKTREKDASWEDVAVMPRRNRPRRSKPSKIEDELQRALLGQRKIQLINPVLEEDMDIKIARAADITRLYEHVRALQLQGTDVRSLGGDGLAWRAIVTLVREMRDHNGGVDFIGLTRTGLMNADFEELATALESLPAPSQGGRSPEVLELLRMDASADVRRRLVKAGEDAGVKVLISRVGGPAL
jgi:hypothetical protein